MKSVIAPEGGSFGIPYIFEDKEGSFWLCNSWQEQHKLSGKRWLK